VSVYVLVAIIKKRLNLSRGLAQYEERAADGPETQPSHLQVSVVVDY